jgi:hypothetical protein
MDKIKEILKYAEVGDVVIRERFNEVVILGDKVRRYKLNENEIEKLTKELDKRKIGYEFCECQGCGACL